MNLDTKNRIIPTQKIDEFRSRSKFIAPGFIAILVLIVMVMYLWLNNAGTNSQRLENLVERQTQTRLLANMLYAVQKRSLILHRMLDIEDPFEQDDEYIEFRKHGEIYLKNRERLLATTLTEPERAILNSVDKLATTSGLAQARTADLIMQGQNRQARELLINKVNTIQRALIEKLRSIFESQRSVVESELMSATKEQHVTYWFIISLGSVALALGGFTIFVVKRTRRSEAQLFDQSQWIRELYEISSRSGLTPDEQITETLKLGCQLLNMEIGKVCQVDKTKQTNRFLNVVAPEQYSIREGQELPLDRTFCSVTIDSTGPLAISNVQESEYANYPCYEFSHLESYVSVPLFVNQIKFGTVNFSSTHLREPFTESDIDLLKLITNWISVTLERKISQQISVAKETAEAANKTKSSFLANMSHELRTPLNAILGYNQLIRDELREDGRVQYLDDLDKVDMAGRHLLSLINDVLDLSKIEAGKMEVYLEQFTLKPLIDEIQTTVMPLMEKNHNVFQLEFDNDISTIYADLTKVRQILFNLLSNASKFTQNGDIRLSVASQKSGINSSIRFTIKDTGIGMNREQLNKLFVSFAQADSSTQKNYGGTGLGLAITHRLCQLMRGSISVDSVPGVGSTFTVLLPTTITSAPSPDADRQSAAS
ncbi:MAG: ATP-binding protein [Gammaproteobacteria bacterium]|jgi:signal transduction histidine kinase